MRQKGEKGERERVKMKGLPGRARLSSSSRAALRQVSSAPVSLSPLSLKLVLFPVLALLLLSPLTFPLFPSSSRSASAAGIDSGEVTTAEREGRLAVFDDVWQTVSERYYDPSFHGVDWQAQRALFRPQAEEAAGEAEFYVILRRMLGSLRDAHTRVYPPEEKFDWQRPRFISVGFSVREVMGQPVVIEVEAGSQAERAGLRAGDLILGVDGEPALKLFAHKLEDQAGYSTVAATRLHAMAMLFAGPPDSSVLVQWLDARGRERSASLRREWRERDASLRIERFKGGYSLVRFDAFTSRSALDFLREMNERVGASRGLVLDLRNNGGGEAEAMTEIASAFLPVGSGLGQFIDRSGRVADSPRTRSQMLFAPEAIKRFSGPVVILTGERTSSAAEIFTAALKEAGRAIVIGGPTCGCVLAIRHQHALPDGGELDVSEMDYRTARGERLEGVGISPDETVRLNRRELQAGRDRTLERALELLRTSKQTPPDDGSNLVGNWTGESVCVGNHPACHDEQVIYRFSKPPDASGKLTMQADKLVGGKPELMYVQELSYDAAKGTLVGEFQNSRYHGLWQYTVEGNSMKGTLSMLPERTIARRISVRKEK